MAGQVMGSKVSGLGKWNPLNIFVLAVAGRFGARSKEVERFLKFAIVGAIGWIIDFGTLNILQNTLLRPVEPSLQVKVVMASGTAFTLAVISNFIWNRYWTYPDSRSRSIRRQLVQFFIVSIIALAFRGVFISLTFQPLGQVGADVLTGLGLIQPDPAVGTINQIGTNFAQAIAVVIAMFWNFFVNRYWTYNDVD